MSDENPSHKPGSLSWPWAVQRMMTAANPPPPQKQAKRRWTFMGLK